LVDLAIEVLELAAAFPNGGGYDLRELLESNDAAGSRKVAFPALDPDISRTRGLKRFHPGNEKALVPGPSCVGGTGLEPVTPSLSSRGKCSRLFDRVRQERMIRALLRGRANIYRTRTNYKCCHCCHTRSPERCG